MPGPRHLHQRAAASPVRRVRVRYDRMLALLVATGVTVFALLAGVGSLGPVSAEGGAAPSRGVQARAAAYTAPGARQGEARQATPTPSASPTPSTSPSTASSSTVRTAAQVAADPDGSKTDVAVPAGSGTGRRVVFDMSDQRVWLVDADGTATRTYLVSGSVTDNLHPGQYHVYSRSQHAVGVEDSGTMQYFVRFTRGDNAAIGFHDIPVDRGQHVQTFAQLGTPQSHGCIRQARFDAVRLWDFAPVGTPVSVVA